MGKLLDDLLKQVSPDVVALNPDLFGQPEPVIEEAPAKRRNKYGNVPVDLEGMHFDSGAEAKRYLQLRLMERAGEIRSLKHHEVFVLVPRFLNGQGEKRDGYSYEADFVYEENGCVVIEDVKSVATADNDTFKNKWMLLQYQYRNMPKYVFRITYNGRPPKKQTRRDRRHGG